MPSREMMERHDDRTIFSKEYSMIVILHLLLHDRLIANGSLPQCIQLGRFRRAAGERGEAGILQIIMSRRFA